jgi:D-alanyl-D-alanine carboxypeptidase/D-alanyl-D-alanine-endopeptidase (penicillin-binding protein 4)
VSPREPHRSPEGPRQPRLHGTDHAASRRNARRRQQRRSRHVVAAILVGVALLALVVAFAGGGGGSGAAATPSAGTPLWSARRVPGAVADGVGAQHLQAAMNLAAGGEGNCYEVTQGDTVLASGNADTPIVGASTQKLLVAAAALAALSPDYTYVTKAVAPGTVDGGTLDKLYLVGAGDPGLTTADYAAVLKQGKWTGTDVTTSLEALADAIVAKGVKRIPGGIAGDDSRYDDQRYVPSWKPDYRTSGDIGPMGALTVNDGYANVARKSIADDPALNAAQALTGLLQARGVQVGAPSHATAPGGAAEIASVTSPPLHDVIASMLTSSDNLSAELLVKELGLHDSKQGTTAAGVAAVKARLLAEGLPAEKLALVDGSGLDRGNRLTCDLLVRTLGLAAKPGFATLVDGLPVAGQSGTLIDQMLGTPLAGKLRAKTGSLEGVAGLTGLIDVGPTLRFAFVDTGNFSESAAPTIRQKLASVIGTFPDAPPPDSLVPAPAP